MSKTNLDDDESTCTPFLSDLLANCLTSTSDPSCDVISQHASHFGSSFLDSGWGCGYRNMQMLLSSLCQSSIYSNRVKTLETGIPSLLKLQAMVEEAWSKGFDPQGKLQLGGRLVGTDKWVGATEVFAMLANLGLHCRIVDFHKYSDPTRQKHPALFEWIKDYFLFQLPSRSGGQEHSVLRSQRPILYLQYAGHSRSIAGVRLDSMQRPTHLLVFDPNFTKLQIENGIVRCQRGDSSGFLEPIHAFSREQYQVVCVVGVADERRGQAQKDVNGVCEKIPPLFSGL